MQTPTFPNAKKILAMRKCTQCGHISVCALFRAIAPLLQSFGEKPPFNTEDLAAICDNYVSASALQIFGESSDAEAS
jgi:hypothetical protein